MRKTAGAEARAVRLTKMQELVEAGGPLPIKQAAQRLDVTEMTIRRDLSSADSPLSALGGYVLATTLPGADRYSLDEASDQHAANKRLACERAATWVQPHDSLFIDCGTTMVHFAEALPPDMPLSVVCYSTNIAAVLATGFLVRNAVPAWQIATWSALLVAIAVAVGFRRLAVHHNGESQASVRDLRKTGWEGLALGLGWSCVPILFCTHAPSGTTAGDRKSTRLNSSHGLLSRMPSSA